MAKNYEYPSDMERAIIQAKLETGSKLRAIGRSLLVVPISSARRDGLAT